MCDSERVCLSGVFFFLNVWWKKLISWDLNFVIFYVVPDLVDQGEIGRSYQVRCQGFAFIKDFVLDF